jgi:hypothetical protein
MNTLRTRISRASAVVLAIGLGTLAVATPAQAAVPDRFGFALWSGTGVVPTGTWPAATSVIPGPPGRYQVDFVGQGAARGVAHVTAITPVPHWCQIDAFGPAGADEIVQVSCHKVGGALDPSGFSVIFDSSSGPSTGPGAFGYVDSKASGGVISQYNSVGLSNTVAHGGVGQWLVTLPGLSAPGPMAGSIQATAVNSVTPARCKVANWASNTGGEQVKVFCWDAGGAPLDTEFTMTYQYSRSLYGPAGPPKYFGYLWNKPPVGPVSTNYNSQIGPGMNLLTSAGTGLSLVRFPNLAALPNDLQITAFGGGSEFCGLSNPWSTAVSGITARDVDCFTNAGVALNTGFLISASAAS